MLKASVGAAAWGMISAVSTAKLRSGTVTPSRHAGLFTQRLEKHSHLAPNLSAARESAPACPDQAYEFVTLVDWRQVVLGSRVPARMPKAIHQKSFHVR